METYVIHLRKYHPETGYKRPLPRGEVGPTDKAVKVEAAGPQAAIKKALARRPAWYERGTAPLSYAEERAEERGPNDYWARVLGKL